MLIYSILFLFPLCLYYFSMKRKQISRTKMEKMTLAMGGSMLVGMTIGLFIGGLFHGSFFSSLLLSVFATAVVGLIIGKPHGIIESVEGLFTGGMAGLMGTMTAEMLSIPELRILLLLFFLLMGLGAFWSLQFWRKSPEKQPFKSVLIHGMTMIYLLFTTCLFIWIPPFEEQPSQHEHYSVAIDACSEKRT
ncbi:hypothetical protein SAMN05421736_106168 [Evansella caseinilytica]|uniref:Uncharacterized protein n=1 Tax=Evansella caseinilytica TaxID=1503961 RepID=A0A1H3QHI1_9BACI|nr:hypothetical protein [Evansella caseinilytica]SDZ12465.1 hypothetical protein SAMN05421736_106168 [Evansella caseinilytica]